MLRNRSSGMKLLLALTIVFLLTIAVTSAGWAATFDKHVEVYDWGAASPRIFLNLEQTVTEEMIPWNAFEVQVKRYDPRLEQPFLGEGERRVRDIYPVDAFGRRVDSGQRIALDLEVHPNVVLSSELNYSGFNGWVDTEYTITQVKAMESENSIIDGLVITEQRAVHKPQLDLFTYDMIAFEDPNEGEITHTYAAFAPELDGSGKKPLIIWLHGGGEGGTDPTIPLSANKAVEFAADSLQQYFGGAYVLVPQSPGRWMDPGYNDETAGHTPVENFRGRVYPYTSRYTASLMNLIETYVAENPDIDKSRIYVGGASNGGYMVIRLLLDYPDYFAAAFPVCGSMTPSYLSDEDVSKLVRQNLWFVVSGEDGTVPAPFYTVGVWDRIIKAGSTSAHLSLPARVVDTSGLYRDSDGNPHKYNGHWSWIYVYNNDVTADIDGQQVTLMDWMARQRLQ